MDALDGEQSYVEVECVLPQDQQMKEDEWKNKRLVERKKREAANKRAVLAQTCNNMMGVMMTQRVDRNEAPIGSQIAGMDLI